MDVVFAMVKGYYFHEIQKYRVYSQEAENCANTSMMILCLHEATSFVTRYPALLRTIAFACMFSTINEKLRSECL